jgi:hypothetical protein
MRLAVSTVAVGALIAAASPAFAQKTVDGIQVPEGNSLAEVKQRQAANEEQAKLAQEQLQQNAANQAAYDQAMKAYQEKLAQIQQQKADAERAHEEAMAKWKADTEACKAGDTTRCASN